jgi:hypothetical protein
MALSLRIVRTAGTFVCVLAFALPPVLSIPGPAVANPIAPAFQACDSDGHLYELYVFGIYPTGAHPTSWFALRFCDLPTHGSIGAAEIALKESGSSGVVQGREGTFADQMYNSGYLSPCAPLGPVVSNGLNVTGLEYAGSVLYAVAGSYPPCGSSSLYTLDPVSGASSLIGPTGMNKIMGLAWYGPTVTLYGLAGCSEVSPQTFLVRIDLTTGHATLVGSTGIPGLISLGVASGFLLAGSGTLDGGRLYVVDLATGAATLLPGDDENVVPEIRGLATTPYGFIVPARKPTWGRLKSVYR